MNLKQKVHLGQMYTTGQLLSRGIISNRIGQLFRHSIQSQHLSWNDERTVEMIPLADLRDGHLEVAGNCLKRIATANSVAIGGVMTSLLPISTIGGHFFCG